MKTSFVCPRCGNEDPEYIGDKNGHPYCRKCISFHGDMAPDELKRPGNVLLDLSYSLSKEQQELSNRVLSNFQKGIDTLVYAVCGSGKTEISYGIIAYAMSKGMNVGFALPRRDVVIELYFCLKKAFPENDIVAVYGGHTSKLVGDCIILTTHQLYRYPAYFDLLVLDEIDAFPFKGSDVLNALFRKSIRGHSVLMSATPSKEILKEYSKEGHDLLTLRTRFHKKPIPVPSCHMGFGPFKYVFLIGRLRDYRKRKKPCFVFVPTIEMSASVFKIVSIFVDGGDYVSSKKENRSETIQKFKGGQLSYLVTTAVLERGVTIKDVQVIVFDADNRIYDKASLIQIAGRAGRKSDAPKGEVWFLAKKMTRGIKDAISEIEYCNTFLQNMSQTN